MAKIENLTQEELAKLEKLKKAKPAPVQPMNEHEQEQELLAQQQVQVQAQKKQKELEYIILISMGGAAATNFNMKSALENVLGHPLGQTFINNVMDWTQKFGDRLDGMNSKELDAAMEEHPLMKMMNKDLKNCVKECTKFIGSELDKNGVDIKNAMQTQNFGQMAQIGVKMLQNFSNSPQFQAMTKMANQVMPGAGMAIKLGVSIAQTFLKGASKFANVMSPANPNQANTQQKPSVFSQMMKNAMSMKLKPPTGGV